MRAIVTGAARGIGRAVARRLASDARASSAAGPGHLLLADLHAAELDTLAAELRAGGTEVLTWPADLADASAPTGLAECALAGFGGLDLVVANAGYGKGGTLMEFEPNDWDRNFAVHVRGPWLLARAVHAALRDSRGAFIFTGSISGTHATPALGAYGPSKAAMLMLMRQLAVDWGPDGIRVNAVSPGLTHTSGTDVVYSNPGVKARRAGQIPVRRVAEPEEMAGAVAFLAGPDAAYVQGHDLVVDGGLSSCLMPNLGMAEVWGGKTTGH